MPRPTRRSSAWSDGFHHCRKQAASELDARADAEAVSTADPIDFVRVRALREASAIVRKLRPTRTGARAPKES